MRRRDLLVIGSVAAVAVAIPPILRHWPSDFDFVPINGFPGFRLLQGGAMSAGPVALIGLDSPQSTPIAEVSDPCLAFFGPSGWTEGQLPIAVFSDYFCSVCADLERRLHALEDSGAPVRLIRHELPLLGPRSLHAARVALASRQQGAYEAVSRDLMQRNLSPGAAAVRALADRHGLDPDRLTRDAASEEVNDAIAAELALGRALGIPGTPATFVGRTLVIGNIEDARLDALIELERDTPFDTCA
ncbi:DsbA family protein [Sulfitobacter sp. D35]|uniref:DsbA family protein n=1 Tax=Sulfitobacter sp. D35 TaxID=3083252 RepID=UPI0029700690|nr:DsbA family protein [Sulfitobacter sp. D35]MDW4498151.1 DsbA family protein [Sulfitobacter sp. D35]